MKISAEGRARLQLFGSALLFSTGGTAIKACALTGWQVASFRSLVAALALMACVPSTRPRVLRGTTSGSGWTWRVWLTGVAYAATLVTFVLANKLGPAANAIFLQSTAPLYLLAIAPLVLKESVRPRDLGVFALVAAGAAVLLGGASAGTRVGDLTGLLSGFAWAWTMTGLRWLAKRDDGGSAEASVTAGNWIAFAACLPLAIPVLRYTLMDGAMLLYLGVFQIALAYALLVRSVKRLPAIEAATILLAEPVFNPIWAWLFQGETPGPRVLAGGATILAGAFLGSLAKDRSGRAQG